MTIHERMRAIADAIERDCRESDKVLSYAQSIRNEMARHSLTYACPDCGSEVDIRTAEAI